MDYVAINPAKRPVPLHLSVMTALELAAAIPAAWVMVQALVAAQVADDHRAGIAFVAAMAFVVSLLLGPLIAWIAFLRRADEFVWPALWAPYIWPLLIIAARLA